MKIESEKLIERKLKRYTEDAGGICIKLAAVHVIGLPDRLCLLPGARLFFAELKTTKKKPRKIQRVWHIKLRKLGFRVEVIDRSEQIEKIFKEI